jgi:hypothetical protein
MEQKDIIEGNELIARFMGGLRVLVQNGIVRVKSSNPDIVEKWTIAQYDRDWNWLMDVIDKIEAIDADPVHGRFGVYISSNHCTIQGTKFRPHTTDGRKAYFSDHYGKNKIKAVLLAVIAFIKFYNTNNPHL